MRRKSCLNLKLNLLKHKLNLSLKTRVPDNFLIFRASKKLQQDNQKKVKMFLQLAFVKKRKRKTFQLPSKSKQMMNGVRSKRKRLKRLKSEMPISTKWLHQDLLHKS